MLSVSERTMELIVVEAMVGKANPFCLQKMGLEYLKLKQRRALNVTGLKIQLVQGDCLGVMLPFSTFVARKVFS